MRSTWITMGLAVLVLILGIVAIQMLQRGMIEMQDVPADKAGQQPSGQ